MKDTIEEVKRKQRLKHLFTIGHEIGYSKETLKEISSSLNMGERLSFLSESQIQKIINYLKKIIRKSSEDRRQKIIGDLYLSLRSSQFHR
ncbi:hypothetical protein LEP1GSC036_0978 [Leptospira weilii str. 2006001853]|uniref:Uncharacterized protein n=1 Tax=Leptospira weilii str. 2006001853 TaxID=1001589 RepID=A0A828Z4G8_9LEPT|nr:hypothetical protein LEP1GSC036_0978 [Leptospira weilii str. 2006001853]